MAFKNRRAAARITSRPCDMCGEASVRRDAAHIVDEIKGTGGSDDGDWNGLSLCPNCHRRWDEVLRPKLYDALSKAKATGLPESWKKSNKITEQEPQIDPPETV